MILKKFVSILKIIGKFCVACAEPLLIVLAVVLIGVMLTAILGAFGAFKKQAVIDVGGYTPKCIGEDIELVVKLHKNSFQKTMGCHKYTFAATHF